MPESSTRLKSKITSSRLPSESIQAAVEGRHLKMGIASGEPGLEREMIYSADRREMVVVDHKQQSYSIMDTKTVAEIGRQLNDAMSQMQEALKNVPEDKRAMVEAMMKQRMPQQAPEGSKAELKKTGEEAKHNGYPCVKYDVFRGGHKIRELWVTDWGNVEGGGDFSDVFEDMAGFFREMMDALSGGLGGGFPGGGGESFFEYMKELDGFPVVTRDLGDDGSLDRETTLRSAKRQTIDPDAFEPPSGYKRQEMFPGR